MGKEKREWRKLVKKLRRSRLRQSEAEKRKEVENLNSVEDSNEELTDVGQHQHELDEEAWLARERLSNEVFQAKKRKEQEIAEAVAVEREKIRVEWEEQQAMEACRKEEAARTAKAKQEQQESEFNELLQFLSGDIDTPPLTYLMPGSAGDGEGDESCLYFSRTGACRFYERCRKSHPSPALSSTILITNFYTHISLEQNLTDDTDSGLEFEEVELRKEFFSFYDDVLPEFQKSGNVIQFKVCRNFEPHLRGNVYIQYQNIQESVHAYRKFNGRFYNGKQLTLRFVKLESWRSAICGQFNRGICFKGKSCNYLHVFKDPTNEFLAANRDWENPPSSRDCTSTVSRSKHQRARSRSKSRTRGTARHRSYRSPKRRSTSSSMSQLKPDKKKVGTTSPSNKSKSSKKQIEKTQSRKKKSSKVKKHKSKKRKKSRRV